MSEDQAPPASATEALKRAPTPTSSRSSSPGAATSSSPRGCPIPRAARPRSTRSSGAWPSTSSRPRQGARTPSSTSRSSTRPEAAATTTRSCSRTAPAPSSDEPPREPRVTFKIGPVDFLRLVSGNAAGPDAVHDRQAEDRGRPDVRLDDDEPVPDPRQGVRRRLRDRRRCGVSATTETRSGRREPRDRGLRVARSRLELSDDQREIRDWVHGFAEQRGPPRRGASGTSARRRPGRSSRRPPRSASTASRRWPSSGPTPPA